MANDPESNPLPPDLSRYEGHTPGPWSANSAWSYDSTLCRDGVFYTIVDSGGYAIPLDTYTSDEATANARLIADAPKLLARLSALEARVRGLEAERRWIPVAERMPEPGRRVLVFDPSIIEFPRNDTKVVIGYYRGADHPFGTDWYVPDGCGQVTHWMPLPGPPGA